MPSLSPASEGEPPGANEAAGRAEINLFFEGLAAADSSVLFVDYDGTLAPFVADRDKAVPYTGVAQLLAKVRGAGTRLVAVSGRPAADVVGLLGLEPAPEVFGSHGLERLTANGELIPAEMPEAVRASLAAARRWGETRKLGRALELKPGCVAVHWRGKTREDARALEEDARAAWAEHTEGGALRLDLFDGGLELRAALATKAAAVRTVLEEAGPGAAAAYLGDDRTDEDAFAALRPEDLPVLVRPERRKSRARAWLRPPAELRDFLWRWRCNLEARR